MRLGECCTNNMILNNYVLETANHCLVFITDLLAGLLGSCRVS